MFKRLMNFLRGARQELRNVNWPTRQEAVRLTSVVIGLSLLLAVFLGAFDYIFSYLIKSVFLKI